MLPQKYSSYCKNVLLLPILGQHSTDLAGMFIELETLLGPRKTKVMK